MSSQPQLIEKPSGPNSPPPTFVRILTIVLLYAVFAGLWILLSDKAVAWLFTDPSDLALVGTLKGLAFVAVTSLLLYGLMRRMLISTHEPSTMLNGRRQVVFSLGLVAMAIIGLTAAAIYYSVNQHRDRAVAQLQAIVDLKSRQIEDWLAERYGDARFLQSNPFWTDLYHRWRDLNDQESWEQLKARMDEFRQHKAFDGIMLLDADGSFMWGSQNIPHEYNPAIGAAGRDTAGQVTHIGPYLDAGGHLHLDFIAPLQAKGKGANPIVVLHVNPAEHLFPLLLDWPVPSPSGETLLFRRDGDHVLYLNELRHRSGTAARLRLGIDREKLLAAKILRNEKSLGQVARGLDYRGKSVFGLARTVRGTDWYLASKLDESELLSSALKDAVWIGLAGLLGVFIATAGFILFRQRQELAAALRESEIKAEKLRALELLGAISKASSDAIFAKDKGGRYLLFNREAARVLGTEPQQVLGRDDTSLFPPEQAALIMANDRKVMLENRTTTFHEKLTTVDGDIVFLATKGPLHDAYGNVIGMFGISRDITELKQTEAALRESTERLQLFIEHAPVALAMLDREMRYLKVSRRWIVDYRLGTQDLIGRSHYDVFPGLPEDWKAVHRRSLAGEVIRADNDRFEFEDGSVQWLRWETRPWRTSTGDVGGIVIFSEDITARKRAEDDLADREKYLRTILQTTADGFCMVDLSGRIVDVNEAYCRMTGYTREELVGMRIETIDAIEAQSEITRRIARIYSRGPELFETRHRRKDGSIFDVELSITGLEAGDGRLVCSCRDITERKKNEAETAKLQARIQQAQKMESIGNLAGGIAHDFNNILFPIIGFSELLLDEVASNGPQGEKVKEVLSAAKRGSDLVRQILAFSRQTEHRVVPVRVQQVLNEVLRLVRATIPADIPITHQIQKECGPVLADPTQLHQIAMNLITNAYHAVEQNRGGIDVALKEAELDADDVADRLIEPGRYAQLTVSDSGTGISPAIMEKIFEPYFTTKEKGKGTGLGLSVVYGIVKEHKGDIKVYSELGIGTTFHIFLPLMEKTADAASPEIKELEANGGERILLVDDEAAVVRMQKNMLERLGYQVSAYTDSVEALDVFKADPSAFDVVLTDMTMPHLTGDQFTKALRDLKPSIPVIICTGFSERMNPEKASFLGIDGFLMKPVIRAEMARMMRQVLDRMKVSPR